MFIYQTPPFSSTWLPCKFIPISISLFLLKIALSQSKEVIIEVPILNTHKRYVQF